MQKILIIEDEVKIRDELSSFLKNNGYEVLIIDNFENIGVFPWIKIRRDHHG